MPSRPSYAALAALAVLTVGCGNADTSPAAPDPSATVRGVVTLGPQCAVERVDEPCPTVPPAGVSVTVHESADGPVLATTTTDVEGRFAVDVAPGDYVVTAEAGMSCAVVEVEASDLGGDEVAVPCDTGIR